MWFGDLVTMRWFNDVWMKEVFANFMAAKIVNPSFPHVNHELRFLLAYYPAAYDVDRTAGTNADPAAARQPERGRHAVRRDHLSEGADRHAPARDASSAPSAFRDGLREYLRRHPFGNATWPDLIALLDARTPEDLAAWSHAWVEERGRPVDHAPSCASTNGTDRAR